MKSGIMMRLVLLLLLFLAPQIPWAINAPRSPMTRDPQALQKNLDALRPGHADLAVKAPAGDDDELANAAQFREEARQDDAIRARRNRDSSILLAVINVFILFFTAAYFLIKRRLHLFGLLDSGIKKKFGRPLLSIKGCLLWSFCFALSLAILLFFSPWRRDNLPAAAVLAIIPNLVMFGNMTYFAYAACRLSVYALCCQLSGEPL